MANQQETEDAMVGALERHERAKSAYGGLFGVSFIAACAALLFVAVHWNLGGWYVFGGTFGCIVIAGVFSDWVMRRAKERQPEQY